MEQLTMQAAVAVVLVVLLQMLTLALNFLPLAV
jgi:hypothetical protein